MKEQYRINSLEELSPDLILALVKKYQTQEVKRLERLYNFYAGQSDIKKRLMEEGKPNNKLQTPYANYITSTLLGYFLGKPISYSSQAENLMTLIQPILDLNNEQSHNATIGKHQSIYGIAYELTYLNEKGDLSFAALNPKETFMVYDTSISAKSLAAIRFYTIQDYVTGKDELYVEVYTSNTIDSYKLEVTQVSKDESQEKLVLISQEIHYFDLVPVSVYKNTSDAFADFETVMDLINAYDLTLSDQQNAIDLFADSYLVISGMDIEEADLLKMKNNRVILTDEKGSASFLIKDASSQGLREYMDKLQTNIHTYSFVPDLSDVNFSGNASGESLKYKLLGLENAVAIKERHYKEGLMNRFKLIINHLNLKGNSFESDDVVATFTRNLPANVTAQIDLVTKLKGVVSDDTLLSQLSFIDDVQDEKLKLALENEDTLNQFGNLNVGE